MLTSHASGVSILEMSLQCRAVDSFEFRFLIFILAVLVYKFNFDDKVRINMEGVGL